VKVEMEGYDEVWFKRCGVLEFLTMDKIPPIDIHHLVQAVYGDNCVAVNTVRCGVQQFKQEAVGEATMCDHARSEARMDFKNL